MSRIRELFRSLRLAQLAEQEAEREADRLEAAEAERDNANFLSLEEVEDNEVSDDIVIGYFTGDLSDEDERRTAREEARRAREETRKAKEEARRAREAEAQARRMRELEEIKSREENRRVITITTTTVEVEREAEETDETSTVEKERSLRQEEKERRRIANEQAAVKRKESIRTNTLFFELKSYGLKNINYEL